MSAIYTIGYQRLTPRALERIADALGIELVIDVRSVPSSRKPGFSRGALSALLGDRYEWRGDTLGGRPGPTAAGLTALAREPRRVLLLCLEEAPGDCHRHRTIAVPLAKRRIAVTHIFRDELIAASELQRAIDDGDEYGCELLPAAALATPAPDLPKLARLFRPSMLRA